MATPSDFEIIAKVLGSVLAPVFLVSALSATLGPMTIRYGRVIDRVRTLLDREAKQELGEARRTHLRWELKAHYRRARLLRAALVCAAGAIFCVASTIVALFAGLMFGIGSPGGTAGLFLLALLLLILAVALFLGDIAISLRVLKADLGEWNARPSPSA